jgi:hypothetical protein
MSLRQSRKTVGAVRKAELCWYNAGMGVGSIDEAPDVEFIELDYHFLSSLP